MEGNTCDLNIESFALELLHQYFPDLTTEQNHRFELLGPLYHEWNKKINLISRNDIEHLYQRHILHSLAIAKYIRFKPGTRVLDVGTGGGFPGIPLAILFPDTSFQLIDSIGKKIMVVKEVINAIKLKNADAKQVRAENAEGHFDFIVSRAVAPLGDIYHWTRSRLSPTNRHALKNGWLILKGGNLEVEIALLQRKTRIVPVSDYFQEPFFAEKYIVSF